MLFRSLPCCSAYLSSALLVGNVHSRNIAPKSSILPPSSIYPAITISFIATAATASTTKPTPKPTMATTISTWTKTTFLSWNTLCTAGHAEGPLCPSYNRHSQFASYLSPTSHPNRHSTTIHDGTPLRVNTSRQTRHCSWSTSTRPDVLSQRPSFHR